MWLDVEITLFAFTRLLHFDITCFCNVLLAEYFLAEYKDSAVINDTAV